EDLLQLIGALGRVVLATRDVGDLLQRVLIDPPPKASLVAAAADAAATEGFAPNELGCARRVEIAAFGRPEADRVDPDAAIGGLLPGVDRQRAGVIGAVRQKDDDVGRIRALRDGDNGIAGPYIRGRRRDVRVDLG